MVLSINEDGWPVGLVHLVLFLLCVGSAVAAVHRRQWRLLTHQAVRALHTALTIPFLACVWKHAAAAVGAAEPRVESDSSSCLRLEAGPKLPQGRHAGSSASGNEASAAPWAFRQTSGESRASEKSDGSDSGQKRQRRVKRVVSISLKTLKQVCADPLAARV